MSPSFEKWAQELSDISASVVSGVLSPKEWQDAVERLHSSIPLEDLIGFVDLDRALKRVQHPEARLGGIDNVKWPTVAGFPKDKNFGHKLFIYRRGSSTPPHAHNHLVSAHIVIKGDLRVRTFDRVEDLERSILIKATRDEIAKPGATVSMSDYRDNVHWFEGVSEYSVSFDTPVAPIEANKKYRHQAEGYNQIFLNPAVKKRRDGLIEAPIIKFDESVKIFASLK